MARNTQTVKTKPVHAGRERLPGSPTLFPLCGAWLPESRVSYEDADATCKECKRALGA